MRRHPKGLIPIVIVGVIAIIAATLVGVAWYYDENKTDETITQGTNENKNFNVNISVNVNTNSPEEELTNIDPIDTTQTTSKDGWKTETYQKNDHGISFQIPTDWNYSESSLGLKDGDYLFSASTAATSPEEWIYLNSLYHKNEASLSLDQWVSEHKNGLESLEYQTYILRDPVTLDGNVSLRLLTQEKIQGDASNIWAFFEGEERVYEIQLRGNAELMKQNDALITTILKSFTLIDPVELITIPAVSATSEVSGVTTSTLSVSWYDTAREINMVDPVVLKENSHYRRAYFASGEVTSGTYAGDQVILIQQWAEGPVVYPDLFRALYDKAANALVYLEKNSDNLENIIVPYRYDSVSSLPGLETPNEIAIPNSDVSLNKEAFAVNRMFISYQNVTQEFTGNAGTMYFDPDTNCYVLKLQDGSVTLYHLQPNFISTFEEREFFAGSNSFTVDVTWIDNTKPTDEYTFNEPTGGCGTSTCHAMFTDEELEPDTRLERVGTTSTGDAIYGYKDDNDETLKSSYDSYYTPYQEVKVTYEEFVNSHPIFYWKDPLGHWLRFKRTDFLPAVECGKPVIYLYPETTTDVNVQVAPNGGFTVTEPAYPVGGWNVTAESDSTLHYHDGNVYPYLFWEGKGINYERPEKGFVVASRDVSGFLDTTLAKLGMNAKEIYDFKEFWVPRMQSKPYYFITFVDQQIFDSLAPLDVTPQPDTVIRVFMDYEGLDTYKTVAPLNIVTPVREGFTVVEWGGALR